MDGPVDALWFDDGATLGDWDHGRVSEKGWGKPVDEGCAGWRDLVGPELVSGVQTVVLVNFQPLALGGVCSPAQLSAACT